MSETRLVNPGDIAIKAVGLVTGERAALHGPSGVNMANIAAFWSLYLSAKMGMTIVIQKDEAAVMMALTKVARSLTGMHNPDDYVDMVGYADIAGHLAERNAALADHIDLEHPR